MEAGQAKAGRGKSPERKTILASTVSIALFEAELAAFARAVGACPTKQAVLVHDCAGWHASIRLPLPGHVHLLFLPPYSPELQPVEHVWPLTNTALVNRHFTSIDELEDVQAARAVELGSRRDLVRSATLFSWWPERIHPETWSADSGCLLAIVMFEVWCARQLPARA